MNDKNNDLKETAIDTNELGSVSGGSGDEDKVRPKYYVIYKAQCKNFGKCQEVCDKYKKAIFELGFKRHIIISKCDGCGKCFEETKCRAIRPQY